VRTHKRPILDLSLFSKKKALSTQNQDQLCHYFLSQATSVEKYFAQIFALSIEVLKL
jgi:hypothetical protein